MSDVLTNEAHTLLARPVLASLTTLGADGSPQVTPLWIDQDGDDLLFNTAPGRRQGTPHGGERPEVAVSVVDPDDPYNVVALPGGRSDRHHRPTVPTPTSTPWPRST